MSKSPNVLRDRIAIMKEATARENGVRLRQPVITKGEAKYIDTHSFLIEEFTISEAVVGATRMEMSDLSQFIKALKRLKGDKRKRQLVKIKLVT